MSQRLIHGHLAPFSTHTLENNVAALTKLEFKIEEQGEVFPPMRFFDVGALVYYAKIIEWEFPNFSVDSCFQNLCQCQKEIEEKGFVQGTEHRFIIVEKKQ